MTTVYQVIDDAIVKGVYSTPEKAGMALFELLTKTKNQQLLDWLRVDVLEVE